MLILGEIGFNFHLLYIRNKIYKSSLFFKEKLTISLVYQQFFKTVPQGVHPAVKAVQAVKWMILKEKL